MYIFVCYRLNLQSKRVCWCLIRSTKALVQRQTQKSKRMFAQRVKAKLKQHRKGFLRCRSGGVGLGSHKHIRIRKTGSRGPILSQHRPASPEQRHRCRHAGAPAWSRGWRRVRIRLMDTNKQTSTKLHKGYLSKVNKLPVTLIMIRVGNCILLAICGIDHLCGIRRMRNISTVSIRIENLDENQGCMIYRLLIWFFELFVYIIYECTEYIYIYIYIYI